MAGKRSGTAKHVLVCVALLICLSISGCALSEGQRGQKGPPPDEGAREHLAHAQKLVVQHNYEAALQEYHTVLSASGGKPPGDEALLYIGQIYSDPQNPKKDFSKSIASLQKLTKEYPQSTWADSARVWAENLREQERLKRVIFESLQENERLKRSLNEAQQENDRLKRVSNEALQENTRLKRVVEESKTVDVEIDEKKRNQAK